MQQFRITLLLFLLHLTVYGQTPGRGVEAIIGMKGSGTLLDDDYITLTGLTFSPGIEINNRWNANINLTFFSSKGHISTVSTHKKITGAIGSTSVSYYLTDLYLNGKISKFRPLAELTLGGAFQYNNERDGKSIAEFDYPGNFDKYRFFSRAKVLLDIRLSSMSIRFGTSYNIFEARSFYPDNERYKSKLITGFGIEIGTVLFIGNMRSNT